MAEVDVQMISEDAPASEVMETPAQAFYDANIEASLNFLEMQDELGTLISCQPVLILFVHVWCFHLLSRS